MNNDVQQWTIATDYLLIDWAALILLILSAFMAVHMRKLLASVAVLGIFSLLMALLYLLLDAPDVALTEAAVGAGISTLLFLCALAFSEREEKPVPKAKRIAPLMIVTLVGATLIYATEGLPPFASPDAPVQQHLAPYYIEYMKEDIDIPNMVTAILASYRGFDTMGEVGVIFTAGIAIAALLMNMAQSRPTPSLQAAPAAPEAPAAPKKPTSKPAATTRKKKPAAKKPAAKKTATKKATAKKPAAKKKAPAKKPAAKKGGKNA